MVPELLHVRSLVFHAYSTMLSVAFIVSVLLGVREANRLDPPVMATPLAGIWVFLGALVGAKVFYLIQFHGVTQLWRALFIWQGGLVYYGGFLGGVIALVLYAVVLRLPVLRLADVGGPYLALGQAITRIGCFLNGCCWGRPAEGLPWALRFPRHSPAFRQQLDDGLIRATEEAALPVHPTQLYMVLGLLVLAVLLKISVNRRRSFNGVIVLQYLFGYGLLRFAVEFCRGDSARSALGMTVSQTVSLLLMAGAVVAWRLAARKSPPQGEAPSGEKKCG